MLKRNNFNSHLIAYFIEIFNIGVVYFLILLTSKHTNTNPSNLVTIINFHSYSNLISAVTIAGPTASIFFYGLQMLHSKKQFFLQGTMTHDDQTAQIIARHRHETVVRHLSDTFIYLNTLFILCN